jgi:hypothetical protein
VPDHSRKSRTISFRISETEYELLRVQCRNIGARSVSDLTRIAIQRITEDHTFEVSVGNSLQALNGRVSELERRVNSLGSHHTVTHEK